MGDLNKVALAITSAGESIRIDRKAETEKQREKKREAKEKSH